MDYLELQDHRVLLGDLAHQVFQDHRDQREIKVL